MAAERGHVVGTLLSLSAAGPMFEAYRHYEHGGHANAQSAAKESTTDGPFSWEGEFFHYRNVNIWPRPYQQPTPPVWMTGLSPETGRMAAERGHVVGTPLSLSAAGPMFEAYRHYEHGGHANAQSAAKESAPNSIEGAAFLAGGMMAEAAVVRQARRPPSRQGARLQPLRQRPFSPPPWPDGGGASA